MYKWLVYLVHKNAEPEIYKESQWFVTKQDCLHDFQKEVLNKGLDIPDSCGLNYYLCRCTSLT